MKNRKMETKNGGFCYFGITYGGNELEGNI